MSWSSPLEKPQAHFAVQVLQTTKYMPEKPLSYETPPPTSTHSHKCLHTVLDQLSLRSIFIFGMRTKTHVGIRVKCSYCCPTWTKFGICWQILISTFIGFRAVCYMRTDTRMKIQTSVANQIGAFWHLFVAIRQTNAGTSNPRRQRCRELLYKTYKQKKERKTMTRKEKKEYVTPQNGFH